jgi:hypothetical protein
MYDSKLTIFFSFRESKHSIRNMSGREGGKKKPLKQPKKEKGEMDEVCSFCK